MRSVTIYRLAPEGFLETHLDDIARLVFRMSSAREEARSVVVSRSNAFLAFSDHESLWNATGEALPPASEAEQLASLFLATANREFDSNLDQGSRVRGLFPREPILSGSYLVSRPRARSASHWLCQFGADLQVDISGARAPVMGAVIEVRIGANGRTVGVTSRWRPICREEPVAFQPLGNGSDTDSFGGPQNVTSNRIRPPEMEPPLPPQPLQLATGDQEPEATLVYLLADDNSPQTIMAPYHAIIDGHDGTFAPATQYSLLIQIAPTASGTLRGIVVGGSGNYSHRWMGWRLDAFGGQPFDLGSSSEIRLPPGGLSVILQVKDQINGAVVQSEATFYGLDTKDK